MLFIKDIPLTPELERAFWQRVQRDEETGCLFWIGTYDREGYGRYTYEGKNYRAHRIAYCLHHRVANLPEGYVPDHLCRIPPCVEWSHLEAVTRRENIMRGASPALARARRLRTHCRAGHALTGENLLLETQGKGWIRQRCRICWRVQTNARGKRWRERQRMKAS
jgi:hypothetical protein